MKVLVRRFNIYLTLAVLLGLVAGCQTSKPKPPAASLRVCIESSPDPTGSTVNITLLRANPVLVTIKRDPILTEMNLVSAKVIEAQGGFALEFKFDENGTWLLEQYSAANPGLHFAVFGQWGDTMADSRWLAAPLISRRISDGVLTFTPDCSREEADKLVTGLTAAIKEIQKKMKQ